MATVIALRGQQDIQKAFDDALGLGIQPYNWIPPVWPSGGAAPTLGDNTSEEDSIFKNYNGYSSPGDFMNQRRWNSVEKDRKKDPGASKGPWPDSSFDTTHEDGDGNPLPDDSRQMRRLGLIFEWALLRATITLGDINNALDNKNLLDFRQQPSTQEAKYNAARDNYISFLQDFSDHEPENKPEPLDPDLSKPLNPGQKGRKSGFGRSMKSAYIAPSIYNGRITGVRIVLVWNPHSSSLGVPIQH